MRRFDLLAADAFAYEWPRRDPPSSLRRPGSPSLCSMVDHLTSLLYVLLPWNWKTESEDVSIFAASRDQPISSGSNRFAAIAGRTGFAQDSSLEGDGFELVWGFSCQAVVSGCCRFFVRSGRAVLRPVASDQVRGARGRGQGTETVAKLGGLPPSGACVSQRLDP